MKLLWRMREQTPAAEEQAADTLSHPGAGVYIFGGLSVLLTISLVYLIVLNLKKRR